ncbi:MAG: trypsin-like peptidase domain-containing protein [bacterium]|nr:trypsin-like peptidase domain-containing protein [bacterium]
MHVAQLHYDSSHGRGRGGWVLALALSLAVCWQDATIGSELPDVSSKVLQAQQDRMRVMRQAAEATISIFGLDGGGGGSGVIITPDGYALTNYHVSSACGDHMRCGLSDGSMVDAVIVGIDATGDVSLIQLLGRDDFPTAPLADSASVQVGQWCFAAGNPFMLASNRQPSISLGIVSGTNRYQYPDGTLLEYADCIQTDAAINPGNSGGPLFNLAGEVIGINGRCSFEKRGRVNVGVGYAISANQIKYFLGVLRSGRLVDHATLGATVSTDSAGKIVVSNILSSSDAFRRGLRYGDEVLSLADREVSSTNMFKNILGTLPKNWRVPMTVRRDGETRTMLVRLTGVHTEKQLIELVSPERSTPPGPRRSDDPTETEKGPQPQQELSERLRGEPDLMRLVPDKQLVQSRLERRPGFANYYYNQMNQQRLWQSLQGQGDFATTAENWEFQGNLAGEKTPFLLRLDDRSGILRIGSRELSVDFQESVSDVVAARDQRGLLVALRAAQQLLKTGPFQIGDSVYLGTAPVYMGNSQILAEQPLMDVLQSLWYDATVRFSFDASGRIALVEVFGDPENDPIELYMNDYQAVEYGEEKFYVPTRLRLQYGTQTTLLLERQSAVLKPSANAASSSVSEEKADS